MSAIIVDRRAFKDGSNGKRELSYSGAALVRASVAAGRNPMEPSVKVDEKNDRISRESRVRSAVNMRTRFPHATQTYLDSRMTNRSHMTEAVANAFCALSAEAVFNIPWLLNIEELHRYSPQPDIELSRPKSKQRTDFIGTTTKGEWYVFEVKGRQAEPSNKQLKEWKKQAGTIKTINKKPPKHRIVAATHLNANNDWTQILYDPPADERAVDLNFVEKDFFMAYYLRLRRRLLPNRVVGETPFGLLYSLGIHGAQVGVHQDFENAAFEGALNRLFQLSRSVRPGIASEEGLHVFSDGIMVRLMGE